MPSSVTVGHSLLPHLEVLLHLGIGAAWAVKQQSNSSCHYLPFNLEKQTNQGCTFLFFTSTKAVGEGLSLYQKCPRQSVCNTHWLLLYYMEFRNLQACNSRNLCFLCMPNCNASTLGENAFFPSLQQVYSDLVECLECSYVSVMKCPSYALMMTDNDGPASLPVLC